MPLICEIGPTTQERFRRQLEWNTLSDYAKGEVLSMLYREMFEHSKIHEGKTVRCTYLGIGTNGSGELFTLEILD